MGVEGEVIADRIGQGGVGEVIATLQDPLAVQAILANRAGSGATAPLGPAPPAPAATT